MIFDWMFWNEILHNNFSIIYLWICIFKLEASNKQTENNKIEIEIESNVIKSFISLNLVLGFQCYYYFILININNFL